MCRPTCSDAQNCYYNWLYCLASLYADAMIDTYGYLLRGNNLMSEKGASTTVKNGNQPHSSIESEIQNTLREHIRKVLSRIEIKNTAKIDK